MCGFGAFSRYGIASFEHTKVPRVLTECIRSKRFIAVSSVPVRLMALALLTRASRPPKVSATFANAAVTWSSKRMSTAQARALPPAASISSAAVKMVPGSFGCGWVVLAATTILAP